MNYERDLLEKTVRNLKRGDKLKELKSDKFTIYLTPRGKHSELPNLVLLHNGIQKSTDRQEMWKFILNNSQNFKDLTAEEKDKWMNIYDKK